MEKIDLENIGSDELFNLKDKERDQLFMEAVEIYLEQVKVGASLLKVDFIDLLKQNIELTERQIFEMEEEEQYEICFFLRGVINRIKKEYQI